MDQTYLKNGQLGEFLDTLRLFGELHGPVISDTGVAAFSPLTDASLLRLDYQRTQIPPKKYLLPFREEILHYAQGSYLQGHCDLQETVLFGVHPCDLDGIAYLDRVFLADRPDPSYAARRARLILVGISCEPDDFCFCSKTAPVSASCDLFLEAHEDGFRLSASTEKGKAIAAAAADLLVEGPFMPTAAGREPCGIPPQDPMSRFSDHPLWKQFAGSCVSCGACSVCCPTCYCFDVREYAALDGGVTRLREWDNCLFLSHGEVAGANFRATRLERLRYRFLHKYCGFTPLQGLNSCVGCGRCKYVCPVDIDLRELIDAGPEQTRGLP